MKRWRDRLVLPAGAALAALAIPAFSQDAQAPEPLLPPGFGSPQEPAPPPAEANANAAAPGPDTSAPSADPGPAPGLDRIETVIEDAATEDLEALAKIERAPPIEIPEGARRPIDVVGVIGPEQWGLDGGAFQGANGRFLSTLMRRLEAPLPSRWTSILLRRALLSRVPAPAYVHPVDWVAERAWLLLRMGEADAARMLVQSVDVDRFTPKMFSIAVQTALATADPAALCPLVAPGRLTSDEPVWPLADAMCAALEGEASTAGARIDQARRRIGARGIDVTLAEKVIGAGINTRRAVTVEWDGVDDLSSWRFGLASATGLEIPARLLARAGPHVRAWQARAPMIPLDRRAEAAEIAASLGVFSNASLVEMYSLLADATDPSELRESVGGRLRVAYAGPRLDDRIGAMRGLWSDAGADPARRRARLVLTAAAAARVVPSSALAEDAPRLIASMLSAGYDARAARWSAAVAAMEGRSATEAWALLALASPRPGLAVSAVRIGAFQDGDDSADGLRTKRLVAALAGLGRLPEGSDVAEDLGLDFAARSRWSRMLERAARTGRSGTVALLAAVGMQTGDWAGVPPEHLYHIVRALRLAGLDFEARMIAAEAVAPL